MKYLEVTSPDINNGPGCRVTLWVAGCGHKCPGCQNPHTWNYNQGKTFDEIRDDLDTQINKPYIQGLTLSGGDPLDQDEESLEELYNILVAFKNHYPDKTIWIYSGYYYEELLKDPLKKKILSICDVLVDGPYIQSQRDVTIPFRGSRNQRIINLKELRK